MENTKNTSIALDKRYTTTFSLALLLNAYVTNNHDVSQHYQRKCTYPLAQDRVKDSFSVEWVLIDDRSPGDGDRRPRSTVFSRGVTTRPRRKHQRKEEHSRMNSMNTFNPYPTYFLLGASEASYGFFPN